MAPLSPRSPTSDAQDRSRYYIPPARLPILSDFPDSPSVYSHTYHSPDTDILSDTTSLSRSASCVDFDDEIASTIHSLSTEGIQDDSDPDDCTDDASHRISLQGPKIRFHSRAPWETDDVIPDHGETDNLKPGTIGSRLRGKAARADNLIRTFTRGSATATRPSVDSARSRVSATSFEVTAGNYSSSRGALYDLARQSMSTSSLSSSVMSPSVRHQTSVRTVNYAKPSRYFTETHGASLDGMPPPSVPFESASARPSSSNTSRISNERSANPSSVPFPQERPSHDDFVHPYANPDLVVYHAPSSDVCHLGDINGSDSNSVITDSTSIKSAHFSVTSTETSTTSLTSRDVSHGNLRVNGKEISSPISVLHQNDISYVDRDTKFLSLHPPPVGFDHTHWSNTRSPTVALISLQEAQARERIRSTTVHTTASRPKLPFLDPDGIPGTTEGQAKETETAGVTARTHVRSTSAGTRPNGEESAVSTSPSAILGRPLKHKKSGFMRLFGGRNSDGEKERSPPLPIPPLVDAYVEESSQSYGGGRTSKVTRVPKPSFSPTLHNVGASSATLASTSSTMSGGDGFDGKGLSSRRRQPPPLSIVTKTTSALLEGKSSPISSSSTPPPLLSIPQSAPPGSTDFPSLKLRPVSVSFSSHFADIVAGADELQHDVHTPSSAASSSTALSPFTPASARRSDDVSPNAVETSDEEHLVIKMLQDQLASAQVAWRQEVCELRGQIRDLTSTLEDLRRSESREYCVVCGRGEQPRRRIPRDKQETKKVGVVNRPRARTGETARFASGN